MADDVMHALEAAAYAECSAPGNGHVCICKHDGALNQSCLDGAAAAVSAYFETRAGDMRRLGMNQSAASLESEAAAIRLRAAQGGCDG